MFGALKRGRFRSLASLIGLLVVNGVGELQRKRTLAASRGFLAAARLSCLMIRTTVQNAFGKITNAFARTLSIFASSDTITG